MIEVTRLNGSRFYINAEHIQMIEAVPDTHILLTNGQAYVVREGAAQVAELVLEYRQAIHHPSAPVPLQIHRSVV